MFSVQAPNGRGRQSPYLDTPSLVTVNDSSANPRGKDVPLPVVTAAPRAGRPVRRSRSGPRRAVVLVVIQLLIVVHVIQWMVSGRTMSPIEPSEAMETVKHGVVNAGAVFFVLALLSTLVLGRWFCGWGCHLVMLQDLCGWLMRRIGIRPRPFRSRLLVYVPFVLAVYMFIWPAVYRWGVVPIQARLHEHASWVPASGAFPPWEGFSSGLTTTDFWRTFPGWLVAVPFLLVCGFGTVYFLGAKGFCTYGCPYGGFFAPLEQLSPARIRVTDACDQTGHCTATCSSNVRVHEEVRAYGMVVDPGCMKCLDCVSVCPNDALYFGLGRPAVAKGPARGREPTPTYDLTTREEIGFALVFLATFLGTRGAYGMIPMLMAVGIAGCVTFLAWKGWRMARDKSVSLYRFRLRFKGSLTRAGAVYALVTASILLLTAHTGAVNGVGWLAGRSDAKVTVPRGAIFSPAPLELPAEMQRSAARALRLYGLAASIGDGGIGLFGDAEHELRRAWLHACRHEFAEAERLLRRYTARHGRFDQVCRDLFLLLRMQLRDDEAEAYARRVSGMDPALVVTLDALVLLLVEDGRSAEAIGLCRTAVRDAGDTATRLYLLRRLSLLLVDHGDLDEGIEVFLETIEMDDRNPATFVMLSRAYRKRGDLGKAIEALERAAALAPDRTDITDELNALK